MRDITSYVLSLPLGLNGICVLLTIEFFVAGCRLVQPVYNLDYGYLLDGRSAQGITEWTLEQRDPEKIKDGIGALKYLISHRPSQAADATSGLVSICRKIWDGWPGLVERPFPVVSAKSSATLDSRGNVIFYMRSILRDAYHILPEQYNDVMRNIHEIDPDIYEGDIAIVREKRTP